MRGHCNKEEAHGSREKMNMQGLSDTQLDAELDSQLIDRAGGGDGVAFESLVSRHYMLVYRVAYKWCGIKENAEDITQEVFVTLARTISGYKSSSAFITWLYRITVNTTKDYIKSNARKIANEAAFVRDRAVAQAGAGTADNPVSPEELYKALDSISPKLKEAVILVLGEGLSHKEAAEVLGCAETTVSWRVFKAKRKLKDILIE